MFEGPEKKFQRHIADYLVRKRNYGLLTNDEITDKDYYFAEDHLYAFLRATQSETLERLEEDYGDDARDEVFRALRDELERRPLWTIFRSGLPVRGHDFRLYFPKPRSSESAAAELYAENRLTLLPELIVRDGKRPDFAIFLNGLPIITIELKHERNQNVHDAVAQYVARDQSDLIFRLPFAHFAADTSDVQVATDPSAEDNFRWFNTGLTNSPQTEGEYPVEFLYSEVLSKDSVLEAIAFYLVRVPKREATEDRPGQDAFTIFPRYHQLRCVDRVAKAAAIRFEQEGDVGLKLLVNHSAGSGKTLTMCWMADRLHSLYKPGTTEKAVNMIFLLTDRKSLDKNVKDDMEKFSHLREVVKYAKRSGDLRSFIEGREQIIVTTQQKFRYILDRIAGDEALKHLRVAFLIDEAHRSQEGSMATAVRTPFRETATRGQGREILTAAEGAVPYPAVDREESVELPEAAIACSVDEPDVEDLQDRRDPQDAIAGIIEEHDLNQLFVAFTATPSPATIQLFGQPFDTYTEAEAIAEGYVVDVAQSIISYKTLYNLHCSVIPFEEELYPPGIVAKALKNVAFQDPGLIQYKSEVMLRIFEEQIEPLIDHKAKAMIVATSRIAGLAYYRIIAEKLLERGAPYKVLYAFSDFVNPETNELITERDVNGLNEGELIEDRFEGDSYRLMVVANKFQTGFDQPLLAGMFLDKAVADRNAVQTISRLNRCFEGKDGVVVVDFTNNAKAILRAFNKYRHGSPHEPEEPDPQTCIELVEEILAIGVFNHNDAASVVALITEDDDASLQALVSELRLRFQDAITAPDERKSFVYLLAKLVSSYHFLSSFFGYAEDVREFVVFCEYVGPQMIKAGSVSDLMKQVRATVVEKAAVTYEGEVKMPKGLIKPKPGRGGDGTQVVKRISVQDMIARISETYDISESEALHIREVSEEKIADESIQQTIVAHREDGAFLGTVYKGQVNGDIQEAYVLRELYEQLGDPKYTDPGAIFDIMAFTVIEKGLELAQAS